MVGRLHGKSGRTSGGFFLQKGGEGWGEVGLWLSFGKSFCFLHYLKCNCWWFLIFLFEKNWKPKRMVEGLVGCL